MDKSLFLLNFLVIHLCLFAPFVFSQEKRCDTVMDSVFGEQFQQEITQIILEKTKNQSSFRAEESVYVIPIIFHIIHKGENVGEGLNISATQVYNQLDALNEDFRRQNQDTLRSPSKFRKVAADTKIEFTLARIDPAGQFLKERGIRRYNGEKSIWSLGNFDALVKPITIWNPNEYLNVWVTDLSGILGYSKFPTASGLKEGSGWQHANLEKTDGVVIDFQAFGSNRSSKAFSLRPKYSLGRTLSHEIGHFLGLIHISGDSGCGKDDFCEDTPLQDRNHYDCNTGFISCGGENMVQNYMDYSDDTCMNLFTIGQALRMRTALENGTRRKQLLLSKVAQRPFEINASNPIWLYPNPATQYVNIDYEGLTIQSYSIYNTKGQFLMENKVNNKLYQIELGTLISGLYLIVFQTDKGIFIKKLSLCY
jgi:hypothetical protein